jgi:hypothetical protein
MRLADVQRDFARAVLQAEAALPVEVTRKAGGVPSRRFGVYRNNVYASLIDVLAGRFPAVERLVGVEFFRAMARIYVEREPSRSAVLIRYGETFPNFARGFAPAASVPYLADLAALEWAWHAAYHAPDAATLALAELAGAAERAAEARLSFHPSLGVVCSRYPIVSIFELNRKGDEVPPARLEGAEDALVARPRLEVALHRLPLGGAHFILALKGGRTIGEAAGMASRQAPGFDLQANLAGLIASGAIVAVETSGN